jgi:hypothetical protein
VHSLTATQSSSWWIATRMRWSSKQLSDALGPTDDFTQQRCFLVGRSAAQGGRAGRAGSRKAWATIGARGALRSGRWLG